MATPVLSAEIRSSTGKKETIKARKDGKLPGVVYSRGADTKEITIDKREALRTLSKFGQNARISLDIEGEKNFVIIKELQREVVNKELIHIDFQTLDENEKIKMVLPIQVINREAVETSLHFLQMNINEIEIQTYPRYLPDKIELDASKLKDKDALTIADLNIGEDENIEISEERDRVIASIAVAEDMEEDLELEEADEEETDEEEEETEE